MLFRSLTENGHAKWKSVQLEETQNEELLRLSKQILELTNAIHSLTVGTSGVKTPIADDAPTTGEPGTS